MSRKFNGPLLSDKKSANPVRRAKIPWLPKKPVFHVASHLPMNSNESHYISVPSSSRLSDMNRAETEQQQLRETIEHDAQNSLVSVESTPQNTNDQHGNGDDNHSASNVDSNLYDAQCRINAAAMAEIDLLKDERRGIMTESNKALKERDVWKTKYDRLLERYDYLQKKFGKENQEEDKRESEAEHSA